MKTYILGAGSSCEFGYPLGKDIFPKAQEMAYSKQVAAQSEKARHLLRAFESVQNNLKSLIVRLSDDPGKWPNFEELFTFLERELIKSEDNRVEGVTTKFKEDLKEMLFFTISVCGFKPFLDEHRLSDKYVACIGKIIQDEPVNFISFNYDVLLPYALKENGVTPNYGYRCLDADASQKGQIINFGDRTANIVLPHGAINLADCPRCSDRYFSINPFTAGIRNERAECPLCKVGLKDDFLIPPSFNKYIEKEKDVKRFFDFVSRSKEIFIVGYSFPHYDYYTRILFMHSLSKNPHNPQLHIIDIGDIETAKEKYNFIDADSYDVNFHLDGFIRFSEGLKKGL